MAGDRRDEDLTVREWMAGTQPRRPAGIARWHLAGAHRDRRVRSSRIDLAPKGFVVELEPLRRRPRTRLTRLPPRAHIPLPESLRALWVRCTAAARRGTSIGKHGDALAIAARGRRSAGRWRVTAGENYLAKLPPDVAAALGADPRCARNPGREPRQHAGDVSRRRRARRRRVFGHAADASERLLVGGVRLYRGCSRRDSLDDVRGSAIAAAVPALEKLKFGEQRPRRRR